MIDIAGSNHGNTRGIGGVKGGLGQRIAGSGIKEGQLAVQGSQLTHVLQDPDGIKDINLAIGINIGSF